MLQTACPVFPARDLDAAETFYHRLGFRTGGRYEEEGYLLLVRDGVEIHFFRDPDHVPERSNHGAYLRVVDATAWSGEIAALGLPAEGIPRFLPAQPKPWGMLELVVIDPDGNLLRAGTDLEAPAGS